MFRETPTVTQNLIIINVLFFIATWVLEQKGIRVSDLLGAHYFNTPLFRPWQLITHAFMHGGIAHLFMNMYMLFMFGSFLERLWGAKRFLMVYLVSALGAIVLYNIAGYIQVQEALQILHSPKDIQVLDALMNEYGRTADFFTEANNYVQTSAIRSVHFEAALQHYVDLSLTPMVGASGAVFGLLAAFALLFPNTEMQLLFPPIPIKAKYLIGGYFILELYLSFHQFAGDHVAHLAHVGGAIVGGAFVLYWRKKGSNFY